MLKEIFKTNNTVYLSLGSNIGDRERNIELAIKNINTIGKVLKVSKCYETEPVGYIDQGIFINAVCKITKQTNFEAIIKKTIKIYAYIKILYSNCRVIYYGYNNKKYSLNLKTHT